MHQKIKGLLPRIGFKKVRTQMFATMLLIIIAISFTATLFIAVMARDEIQDTYVSVNQNNLEVYNELFDLKITRIIEGLRKMVYDDAFIALLLTPNERDGRLMDNRIGRAVRGRINQLISQESLISGIALFDSYDRYIYSYLSSGSTEVLSSYSEYNYTRFNEKESSWYQAALAANGGEVFYGDNALSGNSDDICFVKLLRDPLTGKFLGVIIVSVSVDILEDIVLNWDRDRDYNSYALMVVDERAAGDQLVYKKYYENSNMFANYLSDRAADISMADSDYIFLTHRNPSTQWVFVSGVLKEDLSSMSNYMFVAVRNLLILTALGALVLALVISSYVSRPLEKLRRAISKFSNDGQIITEEFNNREIGEISAFFKTTVNKNIELNRRILEMSIQEKEAEFHMLQAQINPHFLYNTLDSLYFMAVIHRAEEIAEMTSALSDIFKITLNKGKTFIRLAVELDYIEKYMLIQNMRFANRFTLKIEVGAGINPSACCMLKFLIQPYVENAVLHGLEPKIGPGRVNVICRRQGGLLKVCIEDDGVGMDDPGVLRYGYGNNNVRERIRLFYGAQYDVRVSSAPGRGTQVEFTIPMLSETAFDQLNILAMRFRDSAPTPATENGESENLRELSDLN